MRPKLSARAVVDALLAPPVNHPRTLSIPIQERAIQRHAFQRAAFEAAFKNKPRVISVVGTKGKGSVSELLRSALGPKVGCFTSPHLHGCRERIRVGAEPISVDALQRHGATALDLATKLKADAWGCVFFDRLLATALLHFGESKCPRLVLEAGVGGIHDSTNFFTEEELELAVITSISLDHTALDFLDAHEGTAVVAAGGKKKSKKKAARDPTRPKKALTGYRLFMEATRPTLDVKGKGAMSQLAKMWREMDEAAQRPWNDKARPGQEKAKADDERWKKMSPDERLIHFPPSPSLGPSPPTEADRSRAATRSCSDRVMVTVVVAMSSVRVSVAETMLSVLAPDT